MTRDEDELWRQIVDNYGASPSIDGDADDSEVDDDSAASEPPADSTAAVAEEQETPPRFEGPADPEPEDPPELRAWADEGSYVPPPPEPIPLADPPRMLGWLGVFAAPLIALIALVVGHPFRGLLAVLLVGWFVGGFLYLVRTMPDEPREPWDDGSRI